MKGRKESSKVETITKMYQHERKLVLLMMQYISSACFVCLKTDQSYDWNTSQNPQLKSHDTTSQR